MSHEIQEKLLNFITRNFMVEREEIDFAKSLIDEGIIDSVGLIEIASFIEENFLFKIEEDDMNRDNFGSVIKLVRFIAGRVKS